MIQLGAFVFAGALALAQSTVARASQAQEAPTTILHTTGQGDQHAEALEAELDQTGSRRLVILHSGEGIPQSLQALLDRLSAPRSFLEKVPEHERLPNPEHGWIQRWLYQPPKYRRVTEQVDIYFIHVPQDDLEGAWARLTDSSLDWMEQSVHALKYASVAETQGEAAAEAQAIEESTKPEIHEAERLGLMREMGARFRHGLGIPRGANWSLYRVPRTRMEKLAEGGIAAVKSVINGAIVYGTLLAHPAGGNPVAPVLPAFVAAGWNYFFDYYQRGNFDFRTHGTEFDPVTSRAVAARRFYLFTSFVHSVAVRQSIMGTSHITNDGFNMGWHEAQTALITSAKGTVGKAPIELLIKRYLTNKKVWKRIGVMTLWGLFYSSLQVWDMYGVGYIARPMLWALASGGLIYEVARDYKTLWAGIKRFGQSLARLFVSTEKSRSEVHCKTLLIPLANNPKGESFDERLETVRQAVIRPKQE